MVQLVVNGEATEMPGGSTVADLVAVWCTSTGGVAVARNREVIPRSAWAQTVLSRDDQVELVTATSGG